MCPSIGGNMGVKALLSPDPNSQLLEALRYWIPQLNMEWIFKIYITVDLGSNHGLAAKKNILMLVFEMETVNLS